MKTAVFKKHNIILALFVLVFSFFCFRSFQAAYNNYLNIYAREGVPNSFTPSGGEPYSHLSMSYRIDDLAQIYEFPEDPTIVLDKPVCYYTRENGGYVLAYTYPAGTRVWYGRNFIHDYSLNSFPTDDPGWRYVKRLPLLDENTVPSEFDSEEAFMKAAGQQILAQDPLGMYYIKTSDHAGIVKAVYEQAPDYWRETLTVKAVRLKYGGVFGDADSSDSVLWRGIMFAEDLFLYRSGIYRSPDLYHPYFDTTNIVLLSTSGVLLFLHILLRIRKAK